METAVQDMWDEFRAAGQFDAELVSAFAFGDSPEMADELAHLVLNGPKRATPGLVLEFERDGDPLPRPGDYSIVLNGRGWPVCVIRTTEVEVKPLNKVDDRFGIVFGAEGCGQVRDGGILILLAPPKGGPDRVEVGIHGSSPASARHG
jgi:uncharacterized protein YhfF